MIDGFFNWIRTLPRPLQGFMAALVFAYIAGGAVCFFIAMMRPQ